MTDAQILVLRHLHPGIYASQGGGTTVEYSRHASGPRGWANARTSHSRERNQARLSYGGIGAGAGGIEIVPAGGAIGSGITVPACMDHSEPQPPVGATYEWWVEQIESYERAMSQVYAQMDREDYETV